MQGEAQENSSRPAWFDEQYLVGFLQEHKAECPRCRYNIHKLMSRVCPECGAELCLTVGTVEPHLRAWLTLVVGLCAGAGMGMFWIIVLIANPHVQGEELTTIITSVICIPVAWLAVFLRRWFMRLNTVTQWAFAIGGILLTVFAYISMLQML